MTTISGLANDPIQVDAGEMMKVEEDSLQAVDVAASTHAAPAPQ